LNTLQQKRIGVIGLGNMAGAIVRGLLNYGLGRNQFWVACASEADVPEKQAEWEGVACYGPTRYGHELEKTDLILLGVKPHVMKGVLRNLDQLQQAHPLKKSAVVVSIAAGITLEMMECALGDTTPLIRTMPNTPALVNKGITALCANEHVTAEQKQWVDDVFETAGETYWMEESKLNAFTGLFGSGSAYVLLIMEALAEAGLSVGLPHHVVWEGVPKLLQGTAAMLQAQQKHPAQLKAEVMTPGGTTIRGLEVLEAHSVRAALFEAVQAATQRADEISMKK
jgi:pyrroline-5-carboxylate reductase